MPFAFLHSCIRAFRRIPAVCMALVPSPCRAQQADRAQTEALAQTRRASACRPSSAKPTNSRAQEKSLLGDLRKLEVERQTQGRGTAALDEDASDARGDLAATPRRLATLKQEDIAARAGTPRAAGRSVQARAGALRASAALDVRPRRIGEAVADGRRAGQDSIATASPRTSVRSTHCSRRARLSRNASTPPRRAPRRCAHERRADAEQAAAGPDRHHSRHRSSARSNAQLAGELQGAAAEPASRAAHVSPAGAAGGRACRSAA